jgi:stage III sporulation protein AG
MSKEEEKKSLKQIVLSKEFFPKLIIIFISGILLIVFTIPDIFGRDKATNDNSKNNNNSEIRQNDTNTTSYDTNTYITEMENKLEKILRKVSGIGEVEVMITMKASKKQVPLKDTPTTQESLNEVDGEGGSRTNNNVQQDESTVMITEGGDAKPYIIQELEPKIEGVFVAAEGGDDVNIQMDIMQLAQVLFDVPANKVKVMKLMKGNK